MEKKNLWLKIFLNFSIKLSKKILKNNKEIVKPLCVGMEHVDHFGPIFGPKSPVNKLPIIPSSIKHFP